MYIRLIATNPHASAPIIADGIPNAPPRVKTVYHCFAASGAGACITAGMAMKERLRFEPGW